MKKYRGIIGKPATGEKYYPRKEKGEILESLLEGNDIRISAPRRIGKTSILMQFLENPVDGLYFTYVDTEWIESGNSFFEELLLKITDSDALDEYGKFSSKAISWLKGIAANIKSTPLFELRDEPVKRDFMKEFRTFINEMELDGNRLILMVDEFPVMLMNIAESEGLNSVKHLLQQLRSIRQDPKLNKKIQFVFTGSVSLFGTLKRLGFTEYLNDVPEIKVNLLSEPEGKEFARGLLAQHNLNLSDEVATYLMRRVNWLSPFFIQVAIKEIRGLEESPTNEVNTSHIDSAFRALPDSMNIYFEPFQARLGRIFKGNELRFCYAFMKYLSENDTIDSVVYHELAVKFGIQSTASFVVETLSYDGYINDSEASGVFIFNSPILQLWWKKHVNS